MCKKIIGLSGRQRCGKTSLSHFMQTEHNAEIITVAQALKELSCKLLGYENVDDLNIAKDTHVRIFIDKNNPTQQHNNWLNVLKEELETDKPEDIAIIEKVINTLLNPTSLTTVRDVLQIIGTNIIRAINQDWHTKKLRENILKSKSDLIIVDDIRYPNEKQVIDDLGGETFFILRPDLSLDVSNHSSENSLVWQDFPDDRVIVNYMGLDSLFKNFNDYFKNDYHFAINNPLLKHGMHDFQNNVINNFGYNLTEDEVGELRQFIIPEMIKHNGCVLLHGIYKERYEGHLFKKQPKALTIQCVWNPFIIENIKLYL